jgi:hypothetical protein
MVLALPAYNQWSKKLEGAMPSRGGFVDHEPGVNLSTFGAT